MYLLVLRLWQLICFVSKCRQTMIMGWIFALVYVSDFAWIRCCCLLQWKQHKKLQQSWSTGDTFTAVLPVNTYKYQKCWHEQVTTHTDTYIHQSNKSWCGTGEGQGQFRLMLGFVTKKKKITPKKYQHTLHEWHSLCRKESW